MAIKSNRVKPIIISPQAREDILNTLSYLKEHWNEKVINDFLQKLEFFYSIISINPRVFSYYNKKMNIRKFAITKQNVIYYRIRRSSIEIITVFDGRQYPKKLSRLLK